MPFVISCDANSHHVSWGSTDTNARGTELFDYIMTNDLIVANEGNSPTFVTRNRKEVLDLTIIDESSLTSLLDWKVDEEDANSDHKAVTFTFTAETKPQKVKKRLVRKTNWSVFNEVLQQQINCLDLTKVGSVQELDKLVDRTNLGILKAIKKSCPLVPVGTNRCRKPWSEQCSILRKESRRRYRLASRLNTDDEWEAYWASRRAYQNELWRTKFQDWKDFCSSLEDQSAIARVSKLLGLSNIQLGMLRNDQGFTTSPQQVLDLMFDTHFPGNQRNVIDSVNQHNPLPLIPNLIDSGKIEAAVNSFAPFKACGPDEICPVHLQKGGTILRPVLEAIFKGCLTFGHIPRSWRRSNVIFIPKPGKATYQEAKSFRPISLTSFSLKTLERIIDWHLKQVCLIPSCNHPDQHAYREGRSTESALHALTSKIDQLLLL